MKVSLSLWLCFVGFLHAEADILDRYFSGAPDSVRSLSSVLTGVKIRTFHQSSEQIFLRASYAFEPLEVALSAALPVESFLVLKQQQGILLGGGLYLVSPEILQSRLRFGLTTQSHFDLVPLQLYGLELAVGLSLNLILDKKWHLSLQYGWGSRENLRQSWGDIVEIELGIYL